MKREGDKNRYDAYERFKDENPDEAEFIEFTASVARLADQQDRTDFGTSQRNVRQNSDTVRL